MAPSAQAHDRSHSLLLAQKLINLRNGASPFTLILDTLEQGSGPVLCEFATRAKISRSKVVLVSFAAAKQPSYADAFVRTRGKSLEKLKSEVLEHCQPNTQRTLILIDSLNPLASSQPSLLPTFISSIIPSPSVSLVAVYHADVPLVLSKSHNEYQPHPLSILSHLATAVLRVSNLHHAVEQRRAENRSLRKPEYGLLGGREGSLIGISRGGGQVTRAGLIFEMELRRRSGRPVKEIFILSPSTTREGIGQVALLSDHPAFVKVDKGQGATAAGKDRQGQNDGGDNSTFSLGLTEKQKQDRDGVVLPYFDAQTDIGGGDGGRILYEMDRDDDFDDEEDEI